MDSTPLTTASVAKKIVTRLAACRRLYSGGWKFSMRNQPGWQDPVKESLRKALRDFTQQTRTAIDKSCVNLEEHRAGLHFFSRRFSIENSTATDHWNGRTCRDAAHERSRFLTKRRAT